MCTVVYLVLQSIAKHQPNWPCILYKCDGLDVLVYVADQCFEAPPRFLFFSLTNFTDGPACFDEAQKTEDGAWCPCTRDRMCTCRGLLQDRYQREGEILAGAATTAAVPG